MKFRKLYYGSDLKSLLQLYVRDSNDPAFRAISYEDTKTGAKAKAL